MNKGDVSFKIPLKKQTQQLLATRTITIQLNDPDIFAQMVKITDVSYDSNAAFKITFNTAAGTQNLGTFKKKDAKSNYSSKSPKNTQFNKLYCYTENNQELTWHQIGNYLAEYDAKTINEIMSVSLRLMRVASRINPKDKTDHQQTLAKLTVLTQKNFKYKKSLTSIEFVAQLLGAAACEIGRAPIAGCTTTFATYDRIKNYKRFSENEPSIKKLITNKIFPKNYDIPDQVKNNVKPKTKVDDPHKYRHATAFSGSQAAMRRASGLQEPFLAYAKAQNIEKLKTDEADRKKETDYFQRQFDRDTLYLSLAGKPSAEDQQVRYDRKLTRHLNAAYQSNGNVARLTKDTSEASTLDAHTTAKKGKESDNAKAAKLARLKNPKYRLTDEEINDYCQTFVRDHLGNFKRDENQLERFLINDDEKIIVISPAVNTVGISGAVVEMPIDYYFSEQHQTRSDVADYLKLLADQNFLTDLKKCDKQQALINIENLLKIKLSLTSNAEEIEADYKDMKQLMYDKAKESGYSLVNLNSAVKVLENREAAENTRNVLYEIMPELMKKKENNATILFGFNFTGVHWVTIDIKVKKLGDQYSFDIFQHDPYGKGQLDDKYYKTLEVAIKTTLKEKFKINSKNITCQNRVSAYPRRQAEDDHTSCGAIVADDITRIASGKEPATKAYNVDAQELRDSQATSLSKQKNTVGNNGETKRKHEESMEESDKNSKIEQVETSNEEKKKEQKKSSSNKVLKLDQTIETKKSEMADKKVGTKRSATAAGLYADFEDKVTSKQSTSGVSNKKQQNLPQKAQEPLKKKQKIYGKAMPTRKEMEEKSNNPMEVDGSTRSEAIDEIKENIASFIKAHGAAYNNSDKSVQDALKNLQENYDTFKKIYPGKASRQENEILDESEGLLEKYSVSKKTSFGM